jgi:hypothetical protein
VQLVGDGTHMGGAWGSYTNLQSIEQYIVIISFLKWAGSSFHALTRQIGHFGDISFRPALCTQVLKLALFQY